LFGTVSSFPNTTSEQIFFFHKWLGHQGKKKKKKLWNQW
jgi:hypothetical protein